MAKKKNQELNVEESAQKQTVQTPGIESFLKDAIEKTGHEYTPDKANKILTKFNHDYDKVIDFAAGNVGIKDVDKFRTTIYDKYKLTKPTDEQFAEMDFIKKPVSVDDEDGYGRYQQLQEDKTLAQSMSERLKPKEEELPLMPQFTQQSDATRMETPGTLDKDKFLTPDQKQAKIESDANQVRITSLQTKIDEIETVSAEQAKRNIKKFGYASKEHEDVGKEYENYSTMLQGAIEEKASHGEMVGYGLGGAVIKNRPEDLAKVKNLRNIKELYGKMGKILGAPQGEKFSSQMSGLLHGFSDNFFTKDFATLGLNEMGRLLNVKDAFDAQKAFQKEGKTEQEIAELMPEEQTALLETYKQLLEIQAGSKGNFGSTLGEGLQQMIPFIAQFAATGGVGASAKKIVKEFVGAKTKSVLTGRIAGAIAKPMVQAAAMFPAELQNYAQRVAPTMDAQGELIEGAEPINAAFKAYLTTVAEVAGEDVGVFTNKWANKAARKNFTKLIANNPTKSQEFLGKLSLALTRETNMPGIQGFVFEGLGEEATGIMQAAIDQDGSFFTGEAQAQVWALSLLASGGFATMSIPNRIKTRSDFKSSLDLLNDIPNAEYAKAAENIAENYDDPVEALGALDQVNQDFEITEEDYYKARNYIGQSAKYNQMNTARALQVEERIAQSVGKDGNVTMTLVDGKAYSVRNPQDLGKGNEGEVVYLKAEDGTVKAVISSKIKVYETKSPDDIVTEFTTIQDQQDEAFQQQQQVEAEAIEKGLIEGNTVETPNGKRTFISMNPDGTATVQNDKGEPEIVNSSEIEAYKTQETKDAEKEEAKQIEEAQDLLLEGIEEGSEIVADELLTEESDVRVVDFSNGQSKIITPEGESVYNTPEDRDAAIGELVSGQMESIDDMAPEQAYGEMLKDDPEIATEIFTDEIATIRQQAEDARSQAKETTSRKEKQGLLVQARQLDQEAQRLDAILADPTLLEQEVEEEIVEEVVEEVPTEQQVFDQAEIINNEFTQEKENAPYNQLSWETDLLGKKINIDSFINESDEANITPEIKKAWFAKKGQGSNLNDLDILAATVSEESDLEVSMQDIIDFVIKYPTGKVEKTTNRMNELQAEYKELVGKSINNHGKLRESLGLEAPVLEQAEVEGFEATKEIPFRADEGEADTTLNIFPLAQKDLKNRTNITKALNELQKKFGIPINVVNWSEVPQEVLDSASKFTKVPKGFYHKGEAYIVSNPADETGVRKIARVSDAKRTYMHEVVLHKGLDVIFEAGPVTLLGKTYNSKSELLDDAFTRMDAETIADRAKIYTNVPLDQLSDSQKRELAEEALATLNETESPRLQVMMDKLYKFIKKMFGFSSKQFSKADLRNLLREHRDLVVARKKDADVSGKVDEQVKFRITESITPDGDDLVFTALPSFDKVKTKQDIAEYNAKIEIINTLFENSMFSQDKAEEIDYIDEGDSPLEALGDMRYFEEIVEEKMDEIDQLEEEDLESGEEKVSDFVDELDFESDKLGLEDLVKQSRPVTDNIGVAGYILPSGEMLDFSDGAGARYADHRSLNIPIKEGIQGTDLMEAFKDQTGAVRMDYEGGMIDMNSKPTYDQISVIRKIIRNKIGDYAIDMKDGDRELAVQNAPMDFALNKIDQFYDDKTLGTGDKDVIRFRISESNADIEDFTKDSKIKDRVYHGTNQNFEKFILDELGLDNKGLTSKSGFWFTNSTEEAQQYADYSAERMVPDAIAHEKKISDLLDSIEKAERKGDYDLSESLTQEMEQLESDAVYSEPSGQNIVNAFIDLKNPLISESGSEGFVQSDIIQKAIDEGNDGVIFKNITDSPKGGLVTDQYLVFSSEQILIDKEAPKFRVAESQKELDDFVKDSKVKETVYHGTNAEFDEFDRSKTGSATDSGMLGKGFYFSKNKKTAESYGDEIKTARLDLRNPLDISKYNTTEELAKYLGVEESILTIGGTGIKALQPYASVFSDAVKSKGHDGVVTKFEIAVFSNEQILIEPTETKIEEEREKVETAPSDAQKESGNYKMGHIKVDGFDISIENPKGSIRAGVNQEGEKWSNIMPADYGYFKGTIGNDKDHIDVFMGDNLESDKVYVVDQVNPQTGAFDEHKVMMGYNSLSEARNAYNEAYDEDWKGLGAITRTTKDGLKEWFKGDTKKPFAEMEESDALPKDIRFRAVWHGGPHEFSRFTTKAIGTGEGNQAFGWGLYFTDKESIARDYANKLRENKVLIGGKTFDQVREEIDSPAMSWIEIYTVDGLSKEEITLKLKDQLKDKPWVEKNKWVEPAINSALEYIKDKDITIDKSGRNLYKVKIHGDKTLNELSFIRYDKEVGQDAIDKIKDQYKKDGLYKEWQNYKDETKSSFDQINIHPDSDGKRIYSNLTSVLGSDKAASEFLLRAGFDGIQYPTEITTKGAHEESFNFVVFDEEAVEIEEAIKFRVSSANPEVQKMLDKLQAVQNLSKTASKVEGLEEERIESFSLTERKAITDKIEAIKEGSKLGEADVKTMMREVKKIVSDYARKALPLTDAGARELGSMLTVIEKTELPEQIEKAFNRIDELAGISTEKIERKKYASKVNRILKWMTGLKKSGTKKVGKFSYEDTKQFQELKDINKKSIDLVKKTNSYKASAEEKAEASTQLETLWNDLNEKPEKNDLDNVMMKLIELRRLGSKASPKLAQIVSEELEAIYLQAKDAKTEEDMAKGLESWKDKEAIKSFLKNDRSLKKLPWYKKAMTQINNNVADIMGNWETIMTMIGGTELRDRMSFILNEADVVVGKQQTNDALLNAAKEIYNVNSKTGTLNKVHELSKKEYELRQPNSKGKASETDAMELSKLHLMDMYNALKNPDVEYDYYMSYGEIQKVDETGLSKEEVKTTRSEARAAQKANGEMTINALMENLSVADRAFADKMQVELDKYYDRLNEIHIKLYNRDLPRVENYWPSTAEREQDIDIMEQSFVDSRHPSATKERTAHRTPIPQDAFNKFTKHVDEAEWYANMGMPVLEANKLFKNTEIKKLIENKRGETFYKNISAALQNVGLTPPAKVIAQQQNSKLTQILNPLLNNWVAAKIGATPSVPLKQLLSAVNYSENMPMEQWAAGFVKNMASPKDTWSEMMKIPYLKARLGDGYSEAVQRALNGDENVHKAKAHNYHTAFKNLMTIGTRYGDITAIVFGGKPYLDYLLKQDGMTEKEAVDKFLQDTLRSQQAPFASTLSKLQNSKNPFLRAMFTFSNTPSQYMRKLFEANQNLRVQKGQLDAGKITQEEYNKARKQTIKAHTIYGLINTVSFTMVGTLVNAMMKGSDPTDEDLWKAMLAQLAGVYTGGLPVIKGILDTATRQSLGMFIYDETSPYTEALNGFITEGIKVLKGDSKDLPKSYDIIGQSVADMLAVPYGNIKKDIKAMPPFREETFKATRVKEVKYKLNDLVKDYSDAKKEVRKLKKEDRKDALDRVDKLQDLRLSKAAYDIRRAYSSAKRKAKELKVDGKHTASERITKLIEKSKVNLWEGDYTSGEMKMEKEMFIKMVDRIE